MASAAEQMASNISWGAFGKAKELQSRILFALGLLIVYRIGTFIPVPGIDPIALEQFVENAQQGVGGILNMFSGGAIGRMAIFALGIMPYISASIIVQLMTAMVPSLEQLKKEGKITSFGVSNFTPSQLDLISTEVGVDVHQIEFSAVKCQALFDGCLDQMLIHKITPMAWAPLGTLFSTDITTQKKRILDQLDSLRVKYNVTSDQLLLAWILKHPSNIHPVIGSTNLERIQASAVAVSIDLTTEDWFKILEASQGHRVP